MRNLRLLICLGVLPAAPLQSVDSRHKRVKFTGPALVETHSRSAVYEGMYFHHNGVPSGHFTPAGNDAVARVIAAYIHEKFGVALATRN